MKTIEEKAKAYDEAVNKLRRFIEQGVDPLITRADVQDFFPELKESEDEKVRKEIIDFLKLPHPQFVGKRDHEKWIAWLEKQGQKDILEDAVLDGNEDGLIAETIRYKHEKQSKQKLDKVKPKFKVGDWIINPRTGLIKHIKNVLLCDNNGNYEFESSSMSIDSVDNSFHLWTIQDAKDGDVLYINNTVSESIMIYKSFNNGLIKKYASYNKFGFEGEHYLTLNDGYITPATKEQCTELFLKMHEAGYEWDSKNKELKKIHIIDKDKAEIDYCFTKMMNGEKVSPKDEEYNGEDYGIDGLWHAMNILERTLGKVDGYQTDDGFLSHQCAITAIKKLYEQKSAAWSKEDERMFDYALDMIEWYSGKNGDKSKLVSDWLKSIKDRVQPQNWTKEDKERYISCLQRLSTGNPEQPETINSKWFKEHVYPQNRWKPSDEQMEALDWQIENTSVSSWQYKATKELMEDLKKLKEE